ncbi:MAG TPA: Asp-tRNA(Asn)/Glu-tRNA(Gln) amidotransferase subunit GatC [Steroidobacteraceae bacterium]|nr:Asp-tRNA(Asn)/Glu-tRNA(Gln) amidotransferase subunit GatC [Steroidobacteraceae bacterium]
MDRDSVAAIAHLARLELDEPELAAYGESLTRILGLVGELDRADTAGVAPMAHPLAGLSQALRPDEVTERDERDRYQANAPRAEAGLYIVPKVIE